MVAWTAAALGLADIGAGIWGSSKAADEMEDANNAALALQQEQYLQGRSDLAPYRSTGSAANNALATAMGLPTYDANSAAAIGDSIPKSGVATTTHVTQAFQAFMGRAPTPYEIEYYTSKRGRADELYSDVVLPGPRKGTNAWYDESGAQPFKGDVVDPTPAPVTGGETPNFSDPNDAENKWKEFYASPGYESRRKEGEGYIHRNFAAGGQYNTGARVRAATKYNQDYASNEFNAYMDRLQGIAGSGQNAAGTTANLGANAASNAGNAAVGAGRSRASGYLGVSGAVSSGINNYLAARPYGSDSGGGGWNGGRGGTTRNPYEVGWT